ncbi:PREDICTED: E3 ubiquitin-protein ligase RNF34 [Dufourea novaeangliae]|uniref:E3 ubiquitin-protein ligase RNF34 n=1 Tax=Dufourea novaeangliae TaxID=178035 RepID=UPI000766F059|nr:PREDICTED: E3 ubiquitin-protein ligase RNF34 [Dufourea novaeangliae]
MSCETCNTKFSFFARKKQCTECLRYFCTKCVIKQLNKIRSCDSCSILSLRPLVRSQIVQMRSKHLRHYLLAKKVSIEDCIEKEDLIELLMIFANGASKYTSRETPDNVKIHSTNNPTSNQSADLKNVNTSESNVRKCETSNTKIDHDEMTKIPSTSFDTSNRQWSDQIKLFNINALSELEYLSVKQLKNLLSTNRVDYKGCTEKRELLDRASRLWQEHRQSKANAETLDENLCKICCDGPIECVFLECGHMTCCINCGKQMSECPICKQYVVRVIRFFKA